MDVSILALLLLTVMALDLQPESNNIICRIGDNQSPINIRHSESITYCDTNKISIGFVDMPVLLETNTNHGIYWNHYHGSFVSVIDNDRNFVQYMGSRMFLKVPAEHTIDEKTFAAELQIQHRIFGNSEDNPIRSKCIISILFEETNTTNPSIITAFINQTANMAAMLQPVVNNSLYYHYYGSSTEPPCKQNINWYVMSKPLPMGDLELGSLRQYYHDAKEKERMEGRSRRVYLLNSTCNLNVDFPVLRKKQGGEVCGWWILTILLIVIGF